MLALELRAASAWLVLSLLTACRSGPTTGTDVGNGASVQLQIQAYEGDVGMTLETGVRLDAVLLGIDRVRFNPGPACDETDTRVDYDGPIVADLVGGGIVGGPSSFAVEGMTFCDVRIGFHTVDAATAPLGTPPELDGLSVRVSGARSDGTPFVVETARNERVELEARDGLFELANGVAPLILGYDVEAWIAALDLDALPAAPILIDETTDPTRLDAFEEAMETSAGLFLDVDGDGVLSPAESAAGAALAE